MPKQSVGSVIAHTLNPEGTMIEISFIACTLLAGQTCQEQRLTFMEQPGSLTVFQCAFTGQVEIAKWTREHPNWSLAPGGFKCRPAGMMAKA